MVNVKARFEDGTECITAAKDLRIARAKDDVGGIQHGLELASRDAHHVADHQQREWLRDGFHQIHVALFAHAVDDFVPNGLHRIEHCLQRFGGEGTGHDGALPMMARIIKSDERAEELTRLTRHVDDGNGAAARAEVLRPTADFHQFGVAGYGEVVVDLLRQFVER